MPQVFLNGRFFNQSITGVQRFAFEITAAIDRLIETGEWPETTVLAPRAMRGRPLGPWHYRRLRLQKFGHTGGHMWEQAELPVASRGGILINLGNTAPILAGGRQIVVIHDAGVFDTPESYSLRFRTWYRVVQRRLADAGAHVVTVSEFARSRIAQHLELDPTRIAVMYEGANHILNVPADGGTLARYDLAPGKFALMVGSGAAHKNIEAMANVAALLERRGMVLAIAGSTNPALVFRPNTEGLSLGRRLGRINDAELRALYESALCLLFPSRYEGFGLPAVEAMACGCPVLASQGGAIEEICGDGALYFSLNDTGSITTAVELLLAEPRLANDLRARGLNRAAVYSWDASARELGNVLRQLR